MHDDTNLEHKFHSETPPKATVLDASDLSKDKEALIEEMYKMGLSNGTLSGVMTGCFKKNVRRGHSKVRESSTQLKNTHKK